MFAVSELEAPLFRWIRELGEGVSDSPAHERFAEAAAALQSALTGRAWLVDDRFPAHARAAAISDRPRV